MRSGGDTCVRMAIQASACSAARCNPWLLVSYVRPLLSSAMRTRPRRSTYDYERLGSLCGWRAKRRCPLRTSRMGGLVGSGALLITLNPPDLASPTPLQESLPHFRARSLSVQAQTTTLRVLHADAERTHRQSSHPVATCSIRAWRSGSACSRGRISSTTTASNGTKIRPTSEA